MYRVWFTGFEKFVSLIYDKRHDYQASEEYEISNWGRVYDKRRNCFKIIALNDGGYPEVRLSEAKLDVPRGTHYTLHRLVALAFIPNPDNLPEVNHIDFDRQNPNHNNLEWVTRLGNEEHKRRANPDKVVMTRDQAREVCKMMSIKDWTYEDILMSVFNIDPSTIIKKKNREYIAIKGLYTSNRKWRDIKKDFEFKPMKSAKYTYTDDVIHDVCRLLAEGIGPTEISRRLDKRVDRKYISSIKVKKKRRDISDQYF